MSRSVTLNCRAKFLYGSLLERYIQAGYTSTHIFQHVNPPVGPAVKLYNGRFLFSSSLCQKSTAVVADNKETPGQRRKSSRIPAAKTSLRRAAVEAQRSKDGIVIRGAPEKSTGLESKVRLI